MSNAPTTPVTPLEIPNAALVAGYDSLMRARDRQSELSQGYAEAVHAAAPGIVAAELRRLAAEIEQGSDDYIRDGASELIRAACRRDKKIAARLRARATELDGGAA